MATEEVIIKTDKAVKNVDDLTASIDKSTDASEDHQETLLDTAAATKVFGVSINSLKAGFNGTITAVKASIKSLGAFKVALAATGIGLLLIALASFQAALKTSKRLADEFSDAGAFVSGVVDQMTASFGKFFESITRNKDGSNRFINLLKNTVKGIAAGIPGLNSYAAALFAVGDAAVIANKEQREFQEGLAEQNLEVTKVNLSIEQLVNQTRRLGVTGAEQFGLVTEALVLFNEKVRLSTAVLDTEESALKANLAQQVTNSQQALDAQIQLTEFQIKRLNTERQLSAQQRELLNRQTESNRRAILEEGKLNEEAHQERLAQIKATDDALILSQAKRGEIITELVGFEIDAERSKNTTISRMESKLGLQFKNSAIGKAINNTREGITKAIAQGGVFGLLQIPLILAAGFSQVKAIVSSFIPPSIKFAKGAIVSGPSHAKGGVRYGRFELEGGEAVINKRSVSMFRPQLSAINQAGGGIALAHGGVIPAGINPNPRLTAGDLSPQVIPVLYKDDVDKLNNRVMVTESRATL